MEHYEYSLRFAIDPDNSNEVIPGLVGFVKDANIDDVMLFSLGAELSRGHLTPREQDALINMMASVKTALPPGVTMSINQWSTLMHNDQGRGLREGQHFTLMTDPLGKQATVQACPLDESFRDYLCNIFARYAELDPFIIWIEDDFRLHNHHPLYWGGCFCEKHMAEYSRRAGKELRREEFVRGILEPGAPHPYRKIWLDVSRDCMVTLARDIGKAIRGKSETTCAGLMSSVPGVHCAEGRDWFGLLSGLAAGGPMIDRIHLPAYQERSPGEYLWLFHCVSMHTRAMIPAETAVCPELENFPYSLFSKSLAFSRFQMVSALPLNTCGMTINFFDFLGNGVAAQDGYDRMLREVKPYLIRVRESGLTSNAPAGVRVMSSRDSSYTLHIKNISESEGVMTTESTLPDFEQLYPKETVWAGILGAFGVAFAYCEDPEIKGEIIAVSGQYFRNLSRSQIKALLENNCALIDGEAVETLVDMGCGDLMCIESLRWEKQDNGACAYEEDIAGVCTHSAIPARASLQTFLGDSLIISYSDGAPVRALTRLMNPEKKVSGHGMTLIGGKALIMPYGRYAEIMPVTLLCPARRDILHHVIEGWADAAMTPVIATGLAHTAAYMYPGPDGLAVFVTNASHDTIPDGLCLFVGNRTVAKVTEVTAAGYVAAGYAQDGRTLRLQTRIGPLECKLFILNNKEA